MNRTQAVAAIVAAGIQAELVLSDDECCDDDIQLLGKEDICVQISATRDGLRFGASVECGEGDDWGVIFGAETDDPVAAARKAIEYAKREKLI